MRNVLNCLFLTFALFFHSSALANTQETKSNKLEYWFNYPVVDPKKPNVLIREDLILEENLIELINNANPGSDIHISIYLFTRKPVAEALISAAKNRKVKISIVVEAQWKSITNAQKKLISKLKSIRNSEGIKLIKIFECHKGCHARVINHNKFFLFSHVKNSKNVIVQSSANLTKYTGKAFENSVVIRGDKKLYRGYLNYWSDLSRNVKNPHYYSSSESDDYPKEGSLKAYFFPQKTGDKLLDILNGIDCSPSNTIVKMTVSNWDIKRGLDTKLNQLATRGCSVTAVLRDDAKKIPCGVRFNLYPEVAVYTINQHPHSKYLIVDGVFHGKRKKIVWTGSHNYSYPSLRSTDDIILEIVDDDAFAKFDKNFETLRLLGKKDAFSVPNAPTNKCSKAYKIAQ